MLQNLTDNGTNILEQLENLIEYTFHIEVAYKDADFKSLLQNFNPNLIISNLNLKDFSGEKALQYSKIFFPEIPFIFISDNYYDQTSIALLKNGSDDILNKKELHNLPSAIFKVLKNSREKSIIKQIKQKRWEESQKYKGLLEHSHDPVIVYKEDGSITYASEAIKTVLGYSKEEFIINPIEYYVHPKDLPKRKTKINQLFTNPNQFFVLPEERILHKNGHYIWVEAVVSDARLSPGIGGFVTNFRDITVTKESNLKLEKTLNELTDYREALIESSIVAITDTEGIITFVNQEFCNVSQYEEVELIGTNLIDFDGQNQNEEFFQGIINQISGGNIWKGELQKTAKNGTSFWVNGTIIPFVNTDGEIYQYFVVMHDITERKQKTKELEATLELVYAQNERLLNFSYIVSHNLRSHASNLSSILDHLTQCDSEEEKNEMLGHLQNVSKSLNDALQNLNEVVSIQSNKTIKTDDLNLLEYINKVLVNLQDLNQDPKSILHLNVPKNLKVNFNKGYLESILQNLIYNCVKYKHPERPLEINISVQKNENTIIFKITDNGLGIDLVKNKNKIFGMYKTFHGNKNALGLGLFMTKNQIEAMGGSIHVESKVNIGTTFILNFKN
jgi:PAS domain S-box-containing protein